MADQIRRASVSIAANIAEGYGRGGKIEFKRYLMIARGSLFELNTLRVISLRLEYLDETQSDELKKLADSVDAMLTKLILSLKTGKDW